MKELLLFLMLSVPALAASPSEIVDSAGPLEAAISALPGLQNFMSQSAYVPGYGLQINGWAAVVGLIDSSYQNALTSLQDVLVGLAPSVQGLAENDWGSVAMTIIGTSEPPEILVRVKPDQPETLETWIDGVKQ